MCKKYICVAKCPELDSDGSRHCIATMEQRIQRMDTCVDYCPCGNRDVWEELIEHSIEEEV